jgi:hypothetical protein
MRFALQNLQITVISHLEKHPPTGWNGQLIFIGVSEGDPLVTDLSTIYSHTLATINWVGAGVWPWAMDHWLRKRPDVIDQSFDWLKTQLGSEESLK